MFFSVRFSSRPPEKLAQSQLDEHMRSLTGPHMIAASIDQSRFEESPLSNVDAETFKKFRELEDKMQFQVDRLESELNSTRAVLSKHVKLLAESVKDAEAKVSSLQLAQTAEISRSSVGDISESSLRPFRTKVNVPHPKTLPSFRPSNYIDEAYWNLSCPFE